MAGELSRLEMENKQLKLQLANALDQTQKYKELNKTGSDAYNDLAKKIKNFCNQITSAEIARKQITSGSTKNLSIDELLEFAIQQYTKERKDFQNFALELSNQIDQRDSLIESLQRQISIYEVQLSQPSYISDTPNYIEPENTQVQNQMPISPQQNNVIGQDSMPMNMPPIGDVPLGLPPINDVDIQSQLQPSMPSMPVSPKNFTNGGLDNTKSTLSNDDFDDDFEPIVPRQAATIILNNPKPPANVNENPSGGTYVPAVANSIPKANQSNGVQEIQREAIKMKLANEKKEKEQMLMLSDIGPIVDEVKNNRVWYEILSLIGEKGYSQRPKIEEELLKLGKDIGGKTSLSSCINMMHKSGLISRDNVNTGYRRFIVLDLARPIGIRVFEEIFKKSPVESEVHRLTRENATKEHGYLIEDARTILVKEFGYKTVSIDRNKNTIPLNNGKKYIPDIVATIDGKNIDYMEVERGTHTNDDFGEKLDKMAMVTKTFHFLAQNQETLDVIKEKTDKWLLKQNPKNISGLVIKYTTLSHLAKRNWVEIKQY